jgi:hypothetical protein
MIRVRLSGQEGAWGGEQPCLLSSELHELAVWLRAVASAPSPTGARLRFVEPELELEVVDHDPEHLFLRVRTRNALAADSPPAYRTGSDDASLVLPLSRAVVNMIAVDAESEADRWRGR